MTRPPHRLSEDPARDLIEPGSIREYVAMLAAAHGPAAPTARLVYSSIPEAILTLAPAEATAPVVLPDGLTPGPVRACFDNAYRLATSRPGTLYVEGYARITVVAAPHAWCLDGETGQILDPTWVSLTGHPSTADYLGIAFTPSFLAQAVTEAGITGILESDWETGKRVLRRGFSLADGVVTGWGDPPPF